jgi:plasmid stabilization system protein ParE
MAFEKILLHPDKNLIIRLLMKGEGVRAISKMLKEKYPDNKKLQLTANTLQDFRLQKLKIEGDALMAIKEETKKRIEQKDEKKEDTKIRQLPAYKEKLKEVIDYHVDLQNELKQLLILIKARTEDLFNRAAAGQITINEEANLQKYFSSWTTTIERWAKYIEKIADKTVETNVNINVIEDQMSVIREAIRETLNEFEPEVAIKFIDKLNSKIANLSYRPPKQVGFNEIRSDVRMLSAEIEVDQILDEDEDE